MSLREARSRSMEAASGGKPLTIGAKRLNVVENQVNEDAYETSGHRDEADHAVYRIFHETRKNDGSLMGLPMITKTRPVLNSIFYFLIAVGSLNQKCYNSSGVRVYAAAVCAHFSRDSRWRTVAWREARSTRSASGWIEGRDETEVERTSCVQRWRATRRALLQDSVTPAPP